MVEKLTTLLFQIVNDMAFQHSLIENSNIVVSIVVSSLKLPALRFSTSERCVCAAAGASSRRRRDPSAASAAASGLQAVFFFSKKIPRGLHLKGQIFW